MIFLFSKKFVGMCDSPKEQIAFLLALAVGQLEDKIIPLKSVLTTVLLNKLAGGRGQICAY